MAKRVLTAQSEDFPRWYQDVIAKAELFRPAPWGAFLRAFGTIPIRRSGYDVGAFGAALAALARGEDVALFRSRYRVLSSRLRTGA